MTTSANVRPAACRRRSRDSSDRRLDPCDRRTRGLLGVGRGVVHQHVDVAADQPCRRQEHERGDEERRDRVSLGEAGRRGDEAREDGERADEVAAEVERVREQRLAPVAPRRSQRDDRPAEVDRQHEPDDREHPPGRVDRAAPPRRTGASRASAATATLTRASTAASKSAARCSALPWPYWCPSSAGRTATPIAKNVSSAATRSVPECSASETSPRLPLARPVPSFNATRAPAAPIETSAVRRCGVMREG